MLYSIRSLHYENILFKPFFEFKVQIATAIMNENSPKIETFDEN